MREGAGRYEFVDALRGIAVMGVVLVHASRQVAPPDGTLRAAMNTGSLGVQLFFVVSALTLYLSWESRSRYESFPARNFMIRRFFRVAPMYYLAIPLYLAIYGAAPSYWAPNGISWWFIPATALFLHGLHPETLNSVVPGGWSVAAEMGFYVILALALPRLRSARSVAAFFIASFLLFWCNGIVVPWLFSYPEPQQYLVRNFGRFDLLSQLPVFAMGMLICLVFKSGHMRRQIAIGGMLVVACGGLFWCPALQLPRHLVAGGLFAGVTLLLACRPSRLLVNRLTVPLGKLSFSIFLLHFAVMEGFARFGISGLFAASNAGSILYFLCVLWASALVSVFSHRYIEQRGVACGARLIEKLEHGARNPAYHS